MSEATVRVFIAGAGIAVVVLTALIGHRVERRKAQVSPLDVSGISGGITLFSDVGCNNCDLVRAMLEETGHVFQEIGYETDPAAHTKVGITGVPLVVLIDKTGALRGRIAGVPSRRRLQHALAHLD